jgi:uncharacterized protein (DUF433 family)
MMKYTVKDTKLSVAVIEDLKRQGMNQSQIAELFGVTRQHVSWIIHTYGGRLTPRQEILKHWPFTVSARMGQATPFRRLRDHAEYVAVGRKNLSEDKITRLRAFYLKLHDNNLVVEFDPDIPPIPGISRGGGWAYRDRQPSDADLLIRENEYTDLTAVGRELWRFPTELP